MKVLSWGVCAAVSFLCRASMRSTSCTVPAIIVLGLFGSYA
jgi:hypothetical protein